MSEYAYPGPEPYLKIDCSTPAAPKRGIPIKRRITTNRPTFLSVIKVCIRNERNAQII